jgi:formylglycine-generating enzyme required for sulfatase activity
MNDPSAKEQNRLLPLTIAGLICFVIAVSTGSAAWFLLGSNSPLREKNKVNAGRSRDSKIVAETKPDEAQLPPIVPTYNLSNPFPVSIPVIRLAPAGELPVEGGEVVLGGEVDQPSRREIVGRFYIAESEVTNAHFREFIRETTPEKARNFARGKDDEPVTNVSWQDARDYCDWLSKKIEAEVRLPSEAEWELAARGREGFKYPWGNDWNDAAADADKKIGFVRPVKSLAANKSPFGAFDMAGNVWEWVADEVVDETGSPKKFGGTNQMYKDVPVRIAKGGAAVESRENVSATARINMPETVRLPIVGFRYVVRREENASGNMQKQ